MTWTDERVELLKKLWADGLSASQIAAELGGVTRNAVIGKVHRLGLSGRAKSPSSAAPHPARAHRGDLPLADRRSRAAGLLLLRRAGHHRAALLRLSFARRLSAAECAPRPPPVPGIAIPVVTGLALRVVPGGCAPSC